MTLEIRKEVYSLAHKWASFEGDSIKIDPGYECFNLQNELLDKKIRLNKVEVEYLESLGFKIKYGNSEKLTQQHIKLIKQSQEEASAIVEELNKANNNGKGGYIGIKNVNKIKNILKQINKDNVAYVVKLMPNIIDYIVDIDALGFGLDITDAYKYVIQPLSREVGTEILLPKGNFKNVPKATSLHLSTLEDGELRRNFSKDYLVFCTQFLSKYVLSSNTSFLLRQSLVG